MPGAVSATRAPLLKLDQLIGSRCGLTSVLPAETGVGCGQRPQALSRSTAPPATSLLAHPILPGWKQAVLRGRTLRSTHLRGFTNGRPDMTVASVTKDTCHDGAGDDSRPGQTGRDVDDMVCALGWCLDLVQALCSSSSSYVGSVWVGSSVTPSSLCHHCRGITGQSAPCLSSPQHF